MFRVQGFMNKEIASEPSSDNKCHPSSLIEEEGVCEISMAVISEPINTN